MKPRQREFGASVGQVFNLAGEHGEDPDRVLRERMKAAIATAAAREYNLKMQRTFAQCPGFIGGDLPDGEAKRGRVVIDPAHAMAAREWIKRRFHYSEEVELSAEWLCFEVQPRARGRAGGPRRVRVSFKPAEQYTLNLSGK